MVPAANTHRHRTGWRRAGAAAAVMLSAHGQAAFAQSSTTLPPTREEVIRTEENERRNGALRLEVEGSMERSPCALDSPEFKSVRFTLRDVQFEGLKGLDPADLAGTYDQAIGTEQPISVVCEIRDRAAAILRNAGYIAAVQVPEQRVTDGVVRFRVVMARLTQVRVRGNATGAEKIIAGYLNRLSEQPVFNRNDAERYLLLASDLPGYTVRLTLRPADTGPGDVLGDVTVQRTPVYADTTVQNGGSEYLGRWGAFSRVQLFGLTGLADRTTIGLFTTSDLKEQQTVQLGHDFVIGRNGVRAGGFFTYAWADPTIGEGIDLKAKSALATFQVDYPFIRTIGRTVRGTAGLDLVNQDVRFNGADISKDRLRVGFLRLGIDAISTDFSPERTLAEPLWRFTGQIDLRKGVDILGASDTCPVSGCSAAVPPSRRGALSTAAVVRALLYGEVRPVPKVTFALRARAQYAWDPVLSFEQFAAGNYTVGRGYDPGSLLGDRGWGTQAEIRVGSTTQVSARKAAMEGYVFVDQARVSSIGTPLTFGRSHLVSAGFGARTRFDRFFLDASLAVPLSKVGFDDRKPGPRFLVSLTSRLWPWTYD